MNSAAILFYIIYLLLLDYITEISCCPSKSEFRGKVRWEERAEASAHTED